MSDTTPRRTDTTPPPSDWVDPDPFRAHVRDLICETGLSWRLIAAHAGISPRAMTALLHGRRGHRLRRLHVTTARALAATTVDSIDADHHDATDARPLRLLMEDLRRIGVTGAELRRHLTEEDLTRLDDPTTWLCSRATAARLTAFYDLITTRSPQDHEGSWPALPTGDVVCDQHPNRLDRKRTPWSFDCSSPAAAKSS